jgi:uncharacterized protein (DUF39 family)
MGRTAILEKIRPNITIHDLRDGILFNPRNAYQNYNCAVNMSDKTIYTYMGMLRPRMANANYATAGQLSPLFNDPCYRTIGVGTRIFLGGAQGFVAWPGTQHNPDVERGRNGVPRSGSATLAVVGDLKEMSPEWLIGRACSVTASPSMWASVFPSPFSMKRWPLHGRERRGYLHQIYDYSMDYPKGEDKSWGR